MSLSSLLNDDNAKPVKAPAIVRRVVAKQAPEEPKKVPDVRQPAVQRPPPKIEIKRENVREEDILTFSIISKILLPKNSIEKIDLMFRKLLDRKLSFATVSKSISQICEKYPPVLQCWTCLLNREFSRSSRLVNKVREVVNFFTMKQMSRLSLMNFMKFLTEAKQSNMPKMTLCATIVSSDNGFGHSHATTTLLRFAMELLPMLPASKRRPKPAPPERVTFQNVIGIEDPNQPFVMPKRIMDVSTVLQRKLRAQQQQQQQQQQSDQSSHHRHHTPPATKYTPSHNRHLIDIANDATAVVFNFMTKSTPVGHEGGAAPPHHHAEAAPPPTRDIHDLLEKLEILEHDHDSIMSFTEDSRTFNHAIDRAGKCVYDEATWEKIKEFLPNQEVRNFVVHQCRSVLPRIEREHYDAVQFASQYLETQPTNAFLRSIAPPEIDRTFTFSFSCYDTNVSEYLQSLILKSPAAAHRNPHVIWFITEILRKLPRFGDAGSTHLIFGPRSLACCLWYFSLLCECITPMFSPDAQPTESWDAVLDIADELTREKYLTNNEKPPRKVLSKILKSIITNRTIVDENAEEVVKHMGMLSQNISHFYPIYSKLNHACSWLRSDPHFPLVRKYNEMFGSATGDGANDRIQSRRALIKKLMSFPSGERMFEFHFDIPSETFTIAPV